MKNQYTNLIKCGDDGFAPSAIVCKHLCNGGPKEYHFLEDHAEGLYLCDPCLQKGPPPNMKEMRVVCIHCTRRLVADLKRLPD